MQRRTYLIETFKEADMVANESGAGTTAALGHAWVTCYVICLVLFLFFDRTKVLLIVVDLLGSQSLVGKVCPPAEEPT